MLGNNHWVCETYEGDKRIAEQDGFACAHCQRIVTVQALKNPEDFGARCHGCGKLICPQCAGKGCTPIAKAIEQHEARMRLHRALFE
jgi:hypothetical protein